MQIYILIDRSGSMKTRWHETLTSVDAYVAELQKNQLKKARISVFAFDSYNGEHATVTLADGVKLKKWKSLAGQVGVAPRGMTPLYDAVGTLATKVASDKPKDAAICIVTDGAENDSKEMSRKQAKLIVDGWKEKEYDVVFLGADFDNVVQAQTVGVAMADTVQMSAGSYAASMTQMATRTAAYTERRRAERKQDA